MSVKNHEQHASYDRTPTVGLDSIEANRHRHLAELPCAEKRGANRADVLEPKKIKEAFVKKNH